MFSSVGSETTIAPENSNVDTLKDISSARRISISPPDSENGSDDGSPRFRSPSLRAFPIKPFQSPIHYDAMSTCSLEQQRKLKPSPDTDSETYVESASPCPPTPVGFFHGGLAETRKYVAQKYTATLGILCISIMAILSIYWGVLFDVKEYMPNIKVAVALLDGLPPYDTTTPIVGPFVRAAIGAEISGHLDHLGFEFIDPSNFDNDPAKVRAAVLNQDYWAAIIIQPNATALLTEAVRLGNVSYDPAGAGQMVYNQARDIETFNFYIIPTLQRLARTITTSFGTSWTSQVLSNSTYSASIYSTAFQAVSPGITFTMLDLRPFDPPVAIPTVTIGLIYLIIIAFFSFTFFIPTHMKFIQPNPNAPHPPLKFTQLIIYRWCATITAYFFLSLAYSLVSLAFKIPFSHSPPPAPSLLNVDGRWSMSEPVINANPYGKATFLVYWMLNWVGMAALGLTCENMAMLLSALSPLPYSALFLIFWVITNVSTGFYAIEIASDFYQWGLAWPLRQIVEGSKALVFGTKNDLGRNFGILLAWVVVSTILWPVACWVMRWKTIKDKQRAAQAERRLNVQKS